MCNFCTMYEIDSGCKLVGVASLDLGDVKGFLQMQTWLEKDDDGEFLLTNELVNNSGESVREITTRIKFCPVCGKELK